MSDSKYKINIPYSFWWPIAIMVIFCAGDPDLIDALIHYLMKL